MGRRGEKIFFGSSADSQGFDGVLICALAAARRGLWLRGPL
jgi:hypothetical protein